jgi:hypothetical protein
MKNYRKYYLEGDLFPYKIEGGAQIPFLYDREHSDLLNKIVKKGVKREDKLRRVYYVIPDKTHTGLYHRVKQMLEFRLRLLQLHLLEIYRKVGKWLVPPTPPFPKVRLKRGMTFLGRSMVMELDPKIVRFKSRFADNIVEFLEAEEHFGNVCRQDKNNYYAYLAKILPDLRSKTITKEQRRKEVEEMKAQRLEDRSHYSRTNGHATSKSVFPQLKESLLCTKV